MKKQTSGEEPGMGTPKEKAAGQTAANSAIYSITAYPTGHDFELNLIKSTPHSVAVVQAKNGGLFVDSNTMAILFGRSHKNLMRGVDKLVSDGAIDRLKIEPIFYQDSYGRQQPAYRLAERDALVLMPFVGGKKAAEGQAKLVDEFLRMRAELLRIAARKGDPVLRAVISEKSVAASLMTDCLLDARGDAGKDTKSHHYINEHLLCNLVLTGCRCSIDERDLDAVSMCRLAKIRMRNAVLILKGLDYPKRKVELRKEFSLTQDSLISHAVAITLSLEAA